MKAACIDTHALIWYLSKPARLGKAAARLLRDADSGRARVFVPAIVPIELVLLRETGRQVVGPAQIEALLNAQPAFALSPLAIPDALEFMLILGIREPFDRMIVASARAAKVPLITADETIQESGLVETIWD